MRTRTLVTLAVAGFAAAALTVATACGGSEPAAQSTTAGGSAAAGKATGTLWAVVRANGTIERSSGRTAGGFLQSPGRYTVEFKDDFSDCAYQVTPGLDGTGVAPERFGIAAPLSNTPEAVLVMIFHDTGSPASTPFSLTVTC
jgi:hypothetical protein